MTHINSIHDASVSTVTGKNQTAKSKTGDAFETALNNAVAKTETTEKQKQSGVFALQEIASRSLEIQSTTDIVSAKTDQLIEMLDKFSIQLGNPGVSLKKISSVLEQIQKDAGDLLTETQRLAPQDSALKDIANQTALTAQTEFIKFQRGDYLS